MTSRPASAKTAVNVTKPATVPDGTALARLGLLEIYARRKFPKGALLRVKMVGNVSSPATTNLSLVNALRDMKVSELF